MKFKKTNLLCIRLRKIGSGNLEVFRVPDDTRKIFFSEKHNKPSKKFKQTIIFYLKKSNHKFYHMCLEVITFTKEKKYLQKNYNFAKLKKRKRTIYLYYRLRENYY